VSVVQPSSFAARVHRVVAAIPAGDVLTYGEVAAEAGAPGAARAVGRVLADAGQRLPWWRVVTASGRLVPGLEEEHAARLRAEGVPCRDGRVQRGPDRAAQPPS
jgi:methylated-DNA-protein-cysteine methyltransferase related protein